MKVLNTIILLGLLFSCGKEEEVSDSDLSNSIEAAVTAMGGASDEESAQNLASFEKTIYEKTFNFLNPIPTAYGAVCVGRAANSSCSSGLKQASYDGCTLGSSVHTLDGSVTLSYSDSGCGMTTPGNEVTRTFNFTRQGPFGSVTTSSDSHQDYRGNTLGGGGKIVYQSGTDYSLSILGKRKTRTRANGASGFDISIRTTSDISVSGGLGRANRVMDGGAIEVIHNVRGYVATLEPTNLSYSSTCCYPVAGSIDITYSGSLEGSGTVTFNSCGDATVTYNGDERAINFYSCE